ncbi:related to kinesin light chain [Serendipita indica DSM 11827]|uniref:Related to kinesin light chain n=1 Tax=Serendipita indica (strain DSM 11827) TaxID=1109443 RepID=G4TU47_SERID|nr:related to kinesin light chain [Serendipita indica DSM 11827]
MANRSYDQNKDLPPLPQTPPPVKPHADSNRSGQSTMPNSRSKVDRLGFLELASGINPIVDIVAIHGLGGHREKSWMTNDGILWLRDLLLADLPNARVLSYGYDADTDSPECVSTLTLRRHAEEFIRALLRRRADHPRRPIIFIAHDTGGIILKLALVICHSQRLGSRDQLRDILTSTHAILFFGTPHSGIDTSLLEQVNHLASAYMKMTDTILKDLRAHSSELEDIQSIYVQASVEIHSVFFSAEDTKARLNVSYSSTAIAGDPNATTIVLHTGHRDLVRFARRGNGDYQTVLKYLRMYFDNAGVEIKEKWVKEEQHRSVAKEEPTSVIAPKPCPPVSRGYVERIYLQSLITQNLLPDSPVKHQPRCILHGLGGAGKTQIATKWIQEHEHRFTRVICVNAEAQTQLEADLQRSIRCLGPDYSQMTWEDAVAYLDGKEKGWLLFFDNADLPYLDLRPYLPFSAHGAVLITTRNRECINYAPDGAVAVGPLEESEAVKLLHTTAGIAPHSDAQSLEIVRELGMLALAITLAGAYIRRTRSLNTFLDIFRKNRNRLLRRQPDLGSDFKYSAYTAFDLSFYQLRRRTQEFLKLCAFLHHSHIPHYLFERSTAFGFITYTVVKACPPPASDRTFTLKLVEIFGKTWDEISFQELIESASQASFIEVTMDGQFYSVNPLVQMYIQDSLSVEEKGDYIRMTEQLLLGAIRPAEGSNAELLPLLPHANRIPLSVQSESIAHTLTFNDFYDSLENWETCSKLLKCYLGRFKRTQGKKHIDSILVMGQLGEALWRCGQLSKAEKMLRETLALQREILGEKDGETIRTMACFGLTLCHRGQFHEAEKVQRDVLALEFEVSGPQHPETIAAMSNLAATLRGLMEKMEQEVFALRREVSGPRHPDTIGAMGNLALTLGDLGRFAEAENMERDVLALQLDISELGNPDTLLASYNLSHTLYRQGRLEEALQLLEETMKIRHEVLGEDHYHTQWARQLLGLIRSAQSVPY